MKGFKSYGNRKISVPFHKGFTCVVGPNGSGKSNIFDAISFVLGRMSAKSMRAGSISDLVFAGTNKQRSAQYTEVSMYFENLDRVFPFEKDEVIISRWVDKSGKSVYRVNGKRETRTFVIDLLNLVGLTPDGYNMIAQGDITRFVKMSSFDRRTIIEEISGIQEYDEKKEKGLRELGKAEENIARVDLVVNEVRSQLNRLENEKNDALRYQYLKDEISKNKGNLLYGELDENTKEMGTYVSKINSKNARKNELISETNDLQEKIVEKDVLLRDREEEFEQKSGQDYVGISREIASMTSKRDTLKMRIDMRDDTRKSNIKKKVDLQEIISRNIETIERIDLDLIDVRSNITNIEEDLSNKESKYSKIVENLENTSNRFFDFKRASDELEGVISSLRSEEYALRNGLTSLSERAISKKDRLNSLQEALEETETSGLESETGRLSEELVSKEEELALLDVQKMRQQETEMSNHLDAVDRKIQSLNRSITEIKSRIGRKREQKEVYGSNLNATDEILKLKETRKIEGIIGKFSDLGKTKKEYSVALEVAAGARMKNIVVEDSDVARECVNHLKRMKMGRLTFLPLNDLYPRFDPERYSSNLSKQGAIDLAINLVQFKEEHRKAFEYVFSNTLIIDNIDSSKPMSKQRMVTLEGDVIETSGAITGGYWKPRKFLESFETQEDEEEIDSLENEFGQYVEKRASLRSDLSELREKIGESSKSEARLTTEINSIRSKRNEIQQRLESLLKKKESVQSQIGNDKEAVKEIEAAIGENQSKIDGIMEELGKAASEKEVIDQKVEEYRSESVEESQTLKDDIANLRKEREDLVSSTVSMKSRSESLEERNRAMEAEITSIDKEISVISEDLESLNNEIGGVELELSSKMEEEQAVASVLKDIKAIRDQLRNELFTMRGQRERSQAEASKLDSDIKVLEVNRATLEERIKELTDESAGYERPEEAVEDLKELKFRITRMEKEKEGLEPINMRAIEEYDGVEDRYIMLSSKHEKLMEEKNSILQFIDEIETKKKDIFMQAYNIVKENFSEIFGELSPKGEGNLVLEDDEDPFSGGLFIEARPEGKELNRTESMSGGEKALTALAFVFAIQKFKPAPFYILDEIDAHLDDDNVRKVSALIKKSSDSSQFIVITHRDVMMTAADRLFGTSVSKDKISKIVSVELEKVSSSEDVERFGVAES